MPHPSGSKDDHDAILVEGLRLLHEGDSEGWRHLLRDHPDRAPHLVERARRLQGHGFLGAVVAPTRVGRYALLERIGRGGMGMVYRARLDGSDQDCAVKIIRPELLDGGSGRPRFAREVAVVRALSHPGIVRIVDVGIDDAEPWYAMELVAGSSLAQLVEAARTDGGDAVADRRTLPPQPAAAPTLRPWHRFVLSVLEQVLEALRHAHERGVLHRDVKPSNVLVGEDGLVKLIDFGLAQVTTVTTITRTGDSLGTLPYMAPELLDAKGSASVRSDLYAVGATMYQALGLQLPFAGANAEGMRHGILHTTPRPLTTLDPGLAPAIADVCSRAMSPEPDRRYASAADFLADVRALLAGDRPRARPAGPWLRARRWLRRHPLKALAWSAALAFGAVLPVTLYTVRSVELHKSMRLSDLYRVRELRDRAKELWPARPDVVSRRSGMTAWLSEVDELMARRARHEADLAAVRLLGRAMTDPERAEDRSWRHFERELENVRRNQKDAEAYRSAGWEDWLVELRELEQTLGRHLALHEGMVFEDPEDARLFHNLGTLVFDLEELAADRAKVVARIEKAEALRVASLETPAATWRDVLADLADPTRSPSYRSLRMEPQFGLVPLGKDPLSGLHEFAHLASGSVAARDATGRIRITEGNGIVLVLLPGGRVRVGADRDPQGPQFDAQADASDTPSIEVRLDPFFVGKFEVTQAQWVRQRGHNNSMIKAGSRVENPDQPTTWTNPVDVVSYVEAMRIASEWGLTLPTGAQWEYAARGGTTGGMWCGDSVASLVDRENLADVRLWQLRMWNRAVDPGSLQPDDGWPVHAPVGSYEPNPFGLFDVLGNVCEFTIDAPRPYSLGLRDGDGRTGNTDSGSIRGKAFNTPPSECDVTARDSVLPDAPSAGLRPIRLIEGPWTQQP